MITRKRNTFILFLICAMSGIACADANERIVVKDVGFSTPESAQYDPVEDVYLVSNINGGFNLKDGNGFISKLKPDGTLVDLKWIDGEQEGITLNAPKGMAVNGRLLYVADIDQVHVFELPNGKPRLSIDIEGSSFLNSATPASDESIYVTDTGIQFGNDGIQRNYSDAIYQVWPDGRYRCVVKDKELNRPNGIAAKGDEIFVVTIPGRHLRIDADGTWSELAPPPIDGMDGHILLDDGRFLMSTFMGSAVYEKRTDDSYHILAGGLKGPADIGLDTLRKRILVPRLMDNELVIISF